MTAHSTALGIASLGRHGDDMIVHMNRDEVKGLQALAQTHGASLSINPHTGMPEAFSLGGVFKSLLPIAAGFALGPGGFNLFGAGGMFENQFLNSALGTGLLVGGTTAALTGNLGTGLMAGLGAGSGFGLSDVWNKMGGLNALKAGQSSADLNASAFGNQGINTIGNSITPVNAALPGETLSTNALEANVNNLASSTPQTQYGLTNGLSKGIGGPGIDLTSGITKNVVGQSNIPLSLTDTASKSLTAPTSLYGKFIEAGGTPGQLLTTVGGGLMGGVEASDFQPKPIDYAASQPKKRIQTGTDASGNPTYTYVPITAYDPRETLNLNDPYANYPSTTKIPDLKLLPETRLYAMGGTVTTGGLRDLYSSTDNLTNPALSRDGYGVGRLDSLARAQSMDQAQTTGYADGGTVAGDTGMNLDALPSLNLNTGTTNPGITAVITSNNNDGRRGPFGNAGINFGYNGRDNSSRGGLFNNAGINFGSNGINPTQQWRTIGMAEGGETHMNLDQLPSLNLGSGRQGYSGGSGDVLASMDPNDPMVQQFFTPGIEKLRSQNNALYGNGPDNILNTMGPNDPIMQQWIRPGIEKMRAENNVLYGNGPDNILNTMGPNDPIMQQWIRPGIEKMRASHNALYGMAQGGYLDGQGDGMSDSIPATIEGKQPARLADGEFVVPADVVSHIGNGSSKAGSKRLYAMLDKVRQARTGTKKQGKEINPAKYMPA